MTKNIEKHKNSEKYVKQLYHNIKTKARYMNITIKEKIIIKK